MLGQDPTLLIITAAMVVAAAVAVSWLATRRRGKRPTHPMGREDSISYYRDLGGRDRAQGVHEEDEVGRWGGRGEGER